MKSKYGNRKTNGYASAKEARRAAELKLLEKAGKITGLAEQVKFELVPKQDGERAAYYIADFAYTDESGKRIIEDTKGVKTPMYRLKKKLMRHIYGIEIQES